MGRKANRAELTAARDKGQCVRLSRTIRGAETLEGFVVGLSAEWALLHRIYDVRLDGWTAVRLDTVRAVERGGRTALVNRVLDHRGERPASFAADLTSAATVIASAARRFPLVGLMREAKRPNSIIIGWPVNVKKKRVVLFAITPDATWEDEPSSRRLASITRIEMGDDYHAALHELGGFPPVV